MVRRGVLRALVPLAVLSVIALAQALTDEPTGAKGTFVAGVIFAAVAGFSVIYDIEAWSLAKQSAVHFGCMAVTVLPCLVLSGWFALDSPLDVLVVLGVFLATGAVVYGIALVVFGKLLNRSTHTRHDDASSPNP